MARRRAWAEDPGDGLDGGGELEPGAVVADGSAAPQVAWAAATGPSTASRAPAAALAAAPAVAMPTWSEPPTPAEVGVLEWLRLKITARPIRPDRSKALDRESGGRLDRLDLWIVVVLVAATFGLRMFRLAEPYQMHFDEVYHARTATEFLQDWRYGYSHDIYEWTHPHLAKYAMAGGLVAWGDDRVSATSDLGVPVRASIIEPRRDIPRLTGGRGGDRVHVVTGSELRSYDLLDRSLVYTAPIPGASSLAYDDVGYRLFIGTDDGQILVFDASGLDGVTSPELAALVAPPSAFGHVDGGIAQLYASSDGRTLLVATKDGRLVTLDADSAETIGDVKLAGIKAFAPGGTGPVVATQAGAVEDPAAAAAVLADLLGGDAATYEARLKATEGGTIVAGIGGPDQKANIDAAIADGRLAGLAVQDAPRVAIADADGRDVRGGADRRRRDEHRARRRGVRAGVRPGRRPAALRDDRRHRRGRAGRDRDDPRRREHGEGRPDPPGDVPAPRAGFDGPVRRRVGDGPRAGRPARRQRLDDLRHRAPRERRRRRLRRRPAGVRPGVGRDGFEPDVPDRRPPADPRVLGRGPGLERRRRQPRVRLARAGRDRRRRDGGDALPPRPDPLPPSRGGGPRRDLHARRRDALRPVADRDERRLRRRLHRRGLHAVRGALDRLLALARRVLGRDAAHRRVPGARARLEVGRALRDRRDRAADPRPERARAGCWRSSGSSR